MPYAKRAKSALIDAHKLRKPHKLLLSFLLELRFAAWCRCCAPPCPPPLQRPQCRGGHVRNALHKSFNNLGQCSPQCRHARNKSSRVLWYGRVYNEQT